MEYPDPRLRGGRLFIAGLTADALIAPWILPGAMNGEAFATYVETQLAPALEPGTVLASGK